MHTILLLGDSLTEYGYVSGWSSRLCNAYIRRADIVNRGLCGYNTRWLLQLLRDPAARRELLPQSARGTALFATLMLGANDCAVNDQHVELDEFRRNLAAIARLVLEEIAPRGGLFLLTPPPIDQPGWNAAKDKPRDCAERTLDQTTRYRAAVIEVARQLREEEGKAVHLVDVHQAVLQYKGVDNNNTNNESSSDEREADGKPLWTRLFSDGLHFNEAGGQVLFDTLMRAIAASPDAEQILPEKIPQIMPLWDSFLPKTQ